MDCVEHVVEPSVSIFSVEPISVDPRGELFERLSLEVSGPSLPVS